MRRFTAPLLLLGMGWGSLALGDPAFIPPAELPPEGDRSDLPSPSPATLAENAMSEDRWLKVTSRLEGASSDIGEAATSVVSTSADIDQAGRLSRLTQLSGLATSLDRRVIQARLAADQLLNP